MGDSGTFNFQEAIIEGFICPSCFNSFGKADLLDNHFRTEHSYRISSSLTENDNNFNQSIIGKTRNLTAEFFHFRRIQVDRTDLETNILLIRLQKLSNIPITADSKTRLAQEQAVISWIDANIELCPRCGTSFGLSWPTVSNNLEDDPIVLQESTSSMTKQTRKGLKLVKRITNALLDSNPIYRRMHHCRLCGHIICADCSFFLSTDSMHQLTKISSSYSSKSSFLLPDIHGLEPMKPINETGLIYFLPKSNSMTSLDSTKSKQSESYHLRICEICKSLLECKAQQIEDNHSIPAILKMYKSLKSEMDKVTKKMPIFSSMASSLNSGEEKYVLEMAKSLRFDILQGLQKVDCLGKEIYNLEEKQEQKEDQDGEAGGRDINRTQVRLTRQIAQFARRFVQTRLPPLRVLPTEEQHRQLSKSRSSSLFQTFLSSTVNLDVSAIGEKKNTEKMNSREVNETCGWMPETTSGGERGEGEAEVKEDWRGILMHQIDMVADYLSQAQAAHRSLEEINGLARNLDELEAELKRTNIRSA